VIGLEESIATVAPGADPIGYRWLRYSPLT